jgi:RNA polymerase sigma-32 factor
MSGLARTATKETSAYSDFRPGKPPSGAARKRPQLRSVGAADASSQGEQEIPAEKGTFTPTAVGRWRRADKSALESYFEEVRCYPLLSREAEHDIAVRFVKTGAEDLAARLVTANLRLVVKIAAEYRGERRNLLDLVQEGNVGLIHAVRKYDPYRGVKLASYASWWIRAYILKFILSNSRLVKIGTTQAQRRLFFGLGKERARLERRGGTIETKQLAANMNVSEKEVIEMQRRLTACEASLDSPMRADDQGDRTYGDLVRADSRQRPDHQSEAAEFREVLRMRLEEFADTLSGRDVEIFRSRLFSEEAATLAEIAGKFGVSRERVRQIEERLKKRLRLHLEASLGDAVQTNSVVN